MSEFSPNKTTSCRSKNAYGRTAGTFRNEYCCADDTIGRRHIWPTHNTLTLLHHNQTLCLKPTETPIGAGATITALVAWGEFEELDIEVIL